MREDVRLPSGVAISHHRGYPDRRCALIVDIRPCRARVLARAILGAAEREAASLALLIEERSVARFKWSTLRWSTSQGFNEIVQDRIRR